MAKKKAATDEKSDEVYTVEVITKARVVKASYDDDGNEYASSKKGKKKRKRKEQPATWEYFVKWDGYDSDANTWEPESNLSQCERLLRSFWQHIGLDDNDYQIGYVVEAKEDWIKTEKEYFKRQLSNDKPRKGKKKEESKYKKVTKKQKTSKGTHAEHQSTSSKALTISSSSSEDDQPLRVTNSVIKRRRLPIVQSDDEVDEGQVSPEVTAKTSANLPPQAEQNERLSPSSLFSGSPSPEASSPEIPLSSNPLPQPQPAPSQATVIKAARPQHPPPKPAPERRPSSLAAKQKVMFPSLLPNKTPGLPPENAGLGRGISTKQRLSQGALQPTLARAPPTVIANVKKPGASKPPNPLASLSFKKTTATPVIPDKHRNPQPVAKPHDFGQPRQSVSGPSSSIVQESGTAPSSMPLAMVSTHESIPAENYSVSTAPEKRHSIPRASQTESSMSNTDMLFLPDPSTTSLIRPMDSYDGPAPPSSLYRKENVGRPGGTNSWTWSGSLIRRSKGNTTEDLCSVTIHDTTDNHGVALSHVLAREKALEFSSFYNVSDMGDFLSACKYPTQFALLGPHESDSVRNGSKLSVIVRYMSKHRKVALVPARLDGEIVSHILLFPSSLRIFWRLFKIPIDDARARGKLVVAHVPWALTPNLIQASPYKTPSILCRNAKTKSVIRNLFDPKAMRMKPLLCHALHILGVPRDLYEFLSIQGRNRVYCIWNKGVQGSRRGKDPETKLLRAVLRECPGARDAGYKSNVRVVFVHVGSLRTLHKLPALTERRHKIYSLQFYTYGTHPSVCPELWGIKEIYPCGGVVTFSPSALLGDAIALLKQIRKLNQHDLWLCYIHPSVLGMAAKLVCGHEDPLNSFDSGNFALRYILDAIEQGLVALLQSPPAPVMWSDKKIIRKSQWIERHAMFVNYKARKALETSLDSFNADFSAVSKANWDIRIGKLIYRDVRRMQLQPAIMRSYRRYVVFKGKSDRSLTKETGGLEWVTAKEFEFRDDFFKKLPPKATTMN